MSRMKIVLPGGSGSVGTLLARHFHAQGHEVTVLSRAPLPSSDAAPWTTLRWDGVSEGPWIESLADADLCINLAGRSVNCRYNAVNRGAIYDSRIASTRLLNRVLSGLDRPPRLWLNASTATIYRHSLDTAMDAGGELGCGELGGNEARGNEPDCNELSTPDLWRFSIRVAKDWEKAFFSTATPRTRKLALRSAITFSPDPGSVFEVLSRLVRVGLGGSQGSGQQMVSWIHGQDFLRAVDFLIGREELSGVINLASPNPLPNQAFMHALRQAWRMPVGLPAPAWVIELGTFLLRTESELVLKSRYVVPGRLVAAGFRFEHPDWQAAARDLVARFKAR